MNNKKNKFYVTTPIYYVNDKPHPFDAAQDEVRTIN